MWRPDLETPPRGETPNWVAKMPKWAARMRRSSGGGQFRHFSNNFSNNISRCLFHTKMCIPYPLLIAVSKFAHLLSTCCKEKSGTYYSETEPINRRQIWSPGLIRLHSILQATSLWRTMYTRTKSATTTHWNSKRWNYCCTKSTFPTSYVDWGYEIKTSKNSPVATLLSYKDVSPVVILLTLFIILTSM